MNMTEFDPDVGKKVSVVKQTSEAHKIFRLKMGFNDGSDRMRQMIGLSGRYYRSWPKHIVAKTLEDAIINLYGNYLTGSKLSCRAIYNVFVSGSPRVS